jgi:hypothetical protein
VYVGDERVGGFPLYRVAMGLEPLAVHLRAIVLWAAASAAVVFGLRALAQRTPRWVAPLAALLGAAAAFVQVAWTDALYPLTAYTAGSAWWSWTRRRDDAAGVLRVAFCVFATLLLARIALNARVQFYGFALAAPALAVLAAALTGWLARGAGSSSMRWASVVALGSVALGHVLPMSAGMEWNTFRVGSAAEHLRVGPKGELVQKAIEYVEQRCPASGSVLVLPEGALLNYLTRRRSPTRYFSLMPPELAMFGEDAVGRALAAQPPDFVVLLHRDTVEYGLPNFGTDYARSIYAWVRANYRPAQLWSVVPGQKPFEPGTAFAVAVLERKQ